jgi:hypothetical protein
VSFNLGQRGRRVKLTTHLHPVQRVRKSGAIPLRLHTTSWRTQRYYHHCGKSVEIKVLQLVSRSGKWRKARHRGLYRLACHRGLYSQACQGTEVCTGWPAKAQRSVQAGLPRTGYVRAGQNAVLEESICGHLNSFSNRTCL